MDAVLGALASHRQREETTTGEGKKPLQLVRSEAL